MIAPIAPSFLALRGPGVAAQRGSIARRGNPRVMLRCVTLDPPEILAPAGSPDSMLAALRAGAGAVYFGLDEGFHARAKASGFCVQNLAQTVDLVHSHAAKAYITFNTLIFEQELPLVIDLVRAIARSGVDALIVQDPAVCLIVNAVAPGLALHASTQMTIGSLPAARFAKDLGVERIVVPRELSLTQIERLAQGLLQPQADGAPPAKPVELEVFVHGALCMAWSGQCLSGEASVGRSANRGQCNQGCRMPYDLMVDGEPVPLGEERYLLSPKDLAAIDQVPELAKLGVRSLKIEGRYKGPQYVGVNVSLYREKAQGTLSSQRQEELLLQSRMAYSRGFSPGHLEGSKHQDLVDGRFPKHRGQYLGTVHKRQGSRILVDTSHTEAGGVRLAQWPPKEPPGLALGAGVVIDAQNPQDLQEAGGRVVALRPVGAQRWELDVGSRGKHLHKVKPGHRVWISAGAAPFRADSLAQTGHAYTLRAFGALGQPLRLQASCAELGLQVQQSSESMLEPAKAQGLDADLLRQKFARITSLGLRLQEVDTDALATGLFVAPSQLKQLKRDLSQALEDARAQAFAKRVCDTRSSAQILETLREIPATASASSGVHWVVLCRTLDQLQACIEAKIPEVDLDWMEFVGLSKAVQMARQAGLVVNIATVRVQKPGEEGYDRRIQALAPDGVLCRHVGALMHFRAMHPHERPRLHGDHTLNVTNSLSAARLLALGLDTLTASHDLSDRQLLDLVEASPKLPLTLTLHHHLALFHNDHCVYAKYLSEGQDFRTCKRPCDQHKVHLRDHQGQEHPVIVDVECRNTVFSAQAQSAAAYFDKLKGANITRFRIEFAWESKDMARKVIDSYLGLASGQQSASQVTQTLNTLERFGVTLGTLSSLR